MLLQHQTTSHNWGMMAFRGIIAIIFGIIALVWPGITLIALVYLFAAYALVDGFIAIVVSIQERKRFSSWWAVLLEGIAGVIIGILAFAWPGITLLLLLYFISAWAIITGIMEIVGAFMYARHTSTGQEIALVVGGILSIILGILLFFEPAAGLLTIVWIIGIYAIIFGVLLVVRAIQHRSTPLAV